MKNFVLLHKYLETGFVSIVAFADNQFDLWDVMYQHPRYGSCRHAFLITENCCGFFGDVPFSLNYVKDSCLLNICKNVAEYLAVCEYAMLKKSYFMASVWFEKAKNSASIGSVILENY